MFMCLHLKFRHYDFNMKIYCICFYAPLPPPFEKGGHIALHMSFSLYVSMLVSFNLVQLITLEDFAPQASNLIGR